MVGRVAALFFGHDHALALGAHDDFVFGLFKVLHFHHAGVAAGSHQRRFVAQVGQVSPAHTWSAPGDDGGVHILPSGDFAHVDGQNLLAAPDVGQRYIHLAVKAAWAQQGGIQNVWAVGGGHHNHALVGFKTVHLDQHLVEGLLALIIATTQTGTALAADGIDFVDENDAGGVFLGVFKHVTHAGRAHADEHFHEVGA